MDGQDSSFGRGTWGQRLVMRITLDLLRWWYARMHRLVIDGPRLHITENLVVFANHRKMTDSFLLGVALFWTGRRTAYELVPVNVPKEKWYTKVWPIRPLLRIWRAMPISIDEHNQTNDPKALRTMVRLLRSGCVLQIFPEGTRSKHGILLPLKASACAIPLLARSSLAIVAHTQRGGTARVTVGAQLTPAQVSAQAGEGSLTEKSERLAAYVAAQLAALIEVQRTTR